MVRKIQDGPTSRRYNFAMRLHPRTLLWGTALLFLSVKPYSLNAADPQSSTDKYSHFFVTAFGKDGSPAVLQESELTVLVDKTPAQVKTVHPAKDDPLLFAILVDMSKSGLESSDSIKQAASQLFEGLSGTERQGYLVLFNTQVAVGRMPLSVSQAKQVLDSSKFGGGTAVYDAIEQTCKRTLSRSGNHQSSRRVVVLISDGEDNQSHVTRASAEEAAIEEGISVFSLALTSSGLEGRGDRSLREISQRTGGFSTEKGVKKAVQLLLAAVNAQSEITVAPTQKSDGKLHSLSIKCAQQDVHLYAPDAVLLE